MKSQPWYITPRISYQEKRAFVVGGGIAGASAAYSLAKRGWEVTLIERGSALAQEASGNPVGIISPLISQKTDPIGQFYWSGFQHIVDRLSGGSIFNQCGILDLGKADKDLGELVIPQPEMASVCKEEASSLCGAELKTGALHIPNGGFVRPADLCAANILSGSDKIKVIFSHNILSLVKNESGWVAVDGEGREIASAPLCIIANASDASAFSQSSFIPLHKVRGQLTFLPGRNLNLQKILCYDGGYVSPEVGGVNYVGATYSRENMSYEISPSDNAENIDNLRKIIDIGDMESNGLQGRASFRAFVPDRRPVIGAVPDIDGFNHDYADLRHGRINKNYPPGKYLEGLYISTAHGSRGLVSAPIAGEIIASMVNGEELVVPQNIVNILSPARFIIKKLSKIIKT